MADILDGYGNYLAQAIDTAYAEQSDEDGMRRHLGASVVGKKCMREVWFSFHWAETEALDGRMLRLFQRGHREEEVFVALLRSVGATVWTEDSNGQQFRMKWLEGHGGGSIDGVAINLPNLPVGIPPSTPALLEIKTHNDKRFKELKTKGLESAQPKHYKQAQVYMGGLGLKFCLYCAVNKNDDSLWFHLFEFDPAMYQHLILRSETIVFGGGLPPRISDTPSWFECQFCPMKGVCFGTKLPRVNCRTCIHSQPERDGTWRCELDKPEITTQPKVGCPCYEVGPEFIQ